MLCKGLASYMKAEQEMFVILGKCQKEVLRWENAGKNLNYNTKVNFSSKAEL